MLESILNKLPWSLRERMRVCLNHSHDPEYLAWYYGYSKKLLKFKGIHKGEDCFIIGNGPSLNTMDLRPLKNYHTFGLNKIYLMFDKIDLNLSYHVAVNPLVIEQGAKEFENLSCPSFLSYRPSKNLIKNLKNVYYILTITEDAYTFSDNIIQTIYEGYTVTYVAMQIAYYMGFANVYLIGVDHNFTCTGTPNDEQIMEGSDTNHFHPDYFSGKAWNLPDLEASELSYMLARFFYTRNGKKIHDATRDGKLNVFPKISFEQALEACKKKNSACR